MYPRENIAREFEKRSTCWQREHWENNDRAQLKCGWDVATENIPETSLVHICDVISVNRVDTLWSHVEFTFGMYLKCAWAMILGWLHPKCEYWTRVKIHFRNICKWNAMCSNLFTWGTFQAHVWGNSECNHLVTLCVHVWFHGNCTFNTHLECIWGM
jgi:hypothetical protein